MTEEVEVSAAIPDSPTGADEFEGGLVPSTITPAVDQTPVAIDPAVAEKLGVSVETLTSLIRSATGGLQAEVQALRAENEAIKQQVQNAAGGLGGMLDANASVGGYPWMYWRKPQTWPDEESRGWISYGPGGKTPKGNRDVGMYSILTRKGLIPVERYGFIEPPKNPNGAEPFMSLLKKGGAQEFPASQVIAYKWHVAPPIRGLIFPQYEAVKAGVLTYVCEACGQQMWFMPGDRMAGVAYRSHLIQAPGHKYTFRDASEAVSRAGLSILPFLASTTGTVEQAMAAARPE